MASIRNAKKILSIFRENGFEAYIVGGAVRDYIMGVESNDIDITTNARPRDTMRIFDKVLTTGIKYGTVTILHNEDKYEIPSSSNAVEKKLIFFELQYEINSL